MAGLASSTKADLGKVCSATNNVASAAVIQALFSKCTGCQVYPGLPIHFSEAEPSINETQCAGFALSCPLAISGADMRM